VQGFGSKLGVANMEFVVVVVVDVVTCFFFPDDVDVDAAGTVVVVTATKGGWGVCSCWFGGGFVGFRSCVPKMPTSICCVVGCWT